MPTDGKKPDQGARLQEARITSVQNETLVASRREQICDAALELFLEKGFAATTIRDICAGSGVNQASIYDYIANKNDILRRLLNQLWFRRDVVSWDKKRKGTVLVYRSVPHLQEEDRRAMRAHDLALIKALSDQLRKRAGPDDGAAEVELLANMLIFLAAFGPMRDWLIGDVPQERVIRSVAAGAAAMAREMLGGRG